jgi:general secretion pathway protein F
LARAAPSGKLSLVLFSQELLALLTAGLGIVEGLEALLEKEANPATRGVLERLLAGLREGKRFSSVLAEQPALFPPLYVGIVRAAEGTSDLPRALERYIDYQQRIDAVRAKVVSASIYPAILLMVGGGVSAVPDRLCGAALRRGLPGRGPQPAVDVAPDARLGPVRRPPWRRCCWPGAAAMAAWRCSACATCARAAAWRACSAPARHRRARPHLRTVAPVPDAGHADRRRHHDRAGHRNRAGHGLARPRAPACARRAPRSNRAGRCPTPSRRNGLTTPISLRMLRVGERTGDMGPMLTQSAAFYDGEISRWIDRFTRTFEPLLMAAIGLVVGAIVVLLYMPIFDLAGDMS